MKTLILVRHAKSSWKDSTLLDRDRPLNKRGKRDAPKMGKHLAERGIHVDLIISSPAKRALSTAKRIAKFIDYSRKIKSNNRLYGHTEWEMLNVIQTVKDDYTCVMIIGHNPEITSFVNQFSKIRIENVPTCGMLTMEFETETWKKIGELEPTFEQFDVPKAV